MNAAAKFSEERLMKVILAPVVSEKATFIADKFEQVIFRVVKDATTKAMAGVISAKQDAEKAVEEMKKDAEEIAEE